MSEQTALSTTSRSAYSGSGYSGLDGMTEDPPGLFGRKTELGQLAKLLNFAAGGQAKSVLISGDPGIGKTALLEAFIAQVRQRHYARVISLDESALLSSEHCYVAIVEGIVDECRALLDEALDNAREYTSELGLEWNTSDLMRAVALIKLQETIGGKEATTQGQLVKAIRSSVPTMKKLNPATNQAIERLVALIVNPWLSVATALINPVNPRIQEALELARKLKAAIAACEAYTPPDAGDSPETSPEAYMDAAHPGEMVIMTANGQTEVTVATPSPAMGKESLVPVSAEDLKLLAEAPSVDVLVEHLTHLFQYVNQTVMGLETAMMLCLDTWDVVGKLGDARRERLKNLMVGLLKATTEQKNMRMMVVLTSRSEGESDSLGGLLYPLFRHKMLLTGLQGKARRQIFKDPLAEHGLKIDDWIVSQVMEFTRAHPLWLVLLQNTLIQRAYSNKISWVDSEFYNKLGLQHPHDCLELSFTRIKLAFIDQEATLLKLLGALIAQYALKPFHSDTAVRELSTSQGVAESVVYSVLHQLYQERFIVEAPSAYAAVSSGGVTYRILCRRVLEFLQLKTQAIPIEVSTDEKLHYLKKIIPLSVASGELDRKKTQEVLQLCQAMDNDEMVHFLEQTFLAHLGHERPVVRATALNNLALIGSDVAFQQVIRAMKDSDAMVRENAAQNLVAMSPSLAGPALADQVADVLIGCIDDDSELVRTLSYQGLTRYKGMRDLLPVFAKGMSDAAEPVRTICVQTLVSLESDSPLLKSTLLDALSDESEQIRKLACTGLQIFSGEETVQRLSNLLRYDPASSVRALAADVLSRLEGPEAMALLIDVLHNEDNENVRIAVVRALSKQKSAQAEELLLDLLEHTSLDFPALLWMVIKGLGDMAMTQRSLHSLELFDAGESGSILHNAVKAAITRIRKRLDEWTRFQEQLGAVQDMKKPSQTHAQEDDDEPEVIQLDIPAYEEALLEL